MSLLTFLTLKQGMMLAYRLVFHFFVRIVSITYKYYMRKYLYRDSFIINSTENACILFLLTFTSTKHENNSNFLIYQKQTFLLFAYPLNQSIIPAIHSTVQDNLPHLHRKRLIFGWIYYYY